MLAQFLVHVIAAVFCACKAVEAARTDVRKVFRQRGRRAKQRNPQGQALLTVGGVSGKGTIHVSLFPAAYPTNNTALSVHKDLCRRHLELCRKKRYLILKVRISNGRSSMSTSRCPRFSSSVHSIKSVSTRLLPSARCTVAVVLRP